VVAQEFDFGAGADRCLEAYWLRIAS